MTPINHFYYYSIIWYIVFVVLALECVNFFRLQDRSVKKVLILLANPIGETISILFVAFVWLQGIHNAMFRQRYFALVWAGLRTVPVKDHRGEKLVSNLSCVYWLICCHRCLVSASKFVSRICTRDDREIHIMFYI